MPDSYPADITAADATTLALNQRQDLELYGVWRASQHDEMGQYTADRIFTCIRNRPANLLTADGLDISRELQCGYSARSKAAVIHLRNLGYKVRVEVNHSVGVTGYHLHLPTNADDEE